MDRIKRTRMIFCKYLQSIAREKNFGIEDFVKATNKSYTEVKKILEGLISPSLDDLVLMAELLNVHVTLSSDMPFGLKKISRSLPQTI